MCGIVGVYTFFHNGLQMKYADALRNMMQAGQVRGRHGSGMFSVFPDAEDKDRWDSTWVKSGGPVENLLKFKGTDDFWKQIMAEGRFVCGHHRWATAGAHTTENAHPFKHKHITLVHNGSLWNIQGEKEHPDSMYFTKDLAEAGGKWMEVLTEAWGPYSFVWFDENEQVVRFARNKERPMVIAEEKFGGGLFASEFKMLDWICDRNGIKPEKMYSTEENVVYTLDLKTLEFTQKEIPKKIWFRGNNVTYFPKRTAEYQSLERQLKRATTKKGKMKSYSKLNNIVTGDHVIFSLYDVYKVGQDATSHTQFHYEGMLEDVNPAKQSYEVHFMLHEEKKNFITERLLEGEVSHILSNHNQTSVEIWLKGKSVEPYLNERAIELLEDTDDDEGSFEMYPYTKENTTWPKPDNGGLTLLDGKEMTFKEWEEETKTGCSTCGSALFKHLADGCIHTDAGIMCHKCVGTFTSKKESTK